MKNVYEELRQFQEIIAKHSKKTAKFNASEYEEKVNPGGLTRKYS